MPWVLKGITSNRPVRAKALKHNAFALTGHLWFFSYYFPGRCRAMSFCPFRACCYTFDSLLFKETHYSTAHSP